MSRKRGRRTRQYRLRVRTERRDPIDYAALARAALEHAAQAQHGDAKTSSTDQHLSRRPGESDGDKDAGHGRLA